MIFEFADQSAGLGCCAEFSECILIHSPPLLRGGVHQDKILTEMMHGARDEASRWGFQIVAEIGVAVGGSNPAPRDVLLARHRPGSGAHHTIREKLEYAGSWQDVLVPVVELVNALNVDVVVSGSSYHGCLGLVQAFLASGRLPKALGLGLASGVQIGVDSDLYANLDKNVRWLSGVCVRVFFASAFACGACSCVMFAGCRMCVCMCAGLRAWDLSFGFRVSGSLAGCRTCVRICIPSCAPFPGRHHYAHHSR